jgi:hypothetical protein
VKYAFDSSCAILKFWGGEGVGFWWVYRRCQTLPFQNLFPWCFTVGISGGVRSFVLMVLVMERGDVQVLGIGKT